MHKKTYWAAGIIVALVVIIYMFYSSVPEVETAAAEKGNIQRAVVDTGYVQAANNFDLYANQSARVASLPVKVGQRIQKGQDIMILENLDLAMESNQLRIQLSQAKSAVSSAEAELERGRLDLDDTQAKYNRAQELYNSGAISKVEYDEDRSLLDKAQKTFQEQTESLNASREQVSAYQKLIVSSEQKLSDLQIKSPIDGTLMQLPVQQEQVVAYGTLLARVALDNELEIKADLLSDDLGAVQVGQKVQITAPVLGDNILTGEIIKIYPQAEEKQSALGVIQRRVPVIIALDSTGNLKPGYETRVSITTDSRENVLLVPRESIRNIANNQKQVMIIANGRVTFKNVKTGLVDSKNIEIIEGLKTGDQIIKDGSMTLKENDRVKAKK